MDSVWKVGVKRGWWRALSREETSGYFVAALAVIMWFILIG